MNVNLKSSPLKRILSINDSVITFECVCGKTFQQESSLVTPLTRCSACTSSIDSIIPLTLMEKEELGSYMFMNVLCEYNNKFVSL
ncbi:MAG: hypothetical protein JHC33_09505 [Ignisphaera sp.]|nr:hypothetical protein [Ignisphaera sp.]